VDRVSSSLLGPVDPSFRALSGRLKFTVRRHKFNDNSPFSARPSCESFPRKGEVSAYAERIQTQQDLQNGLGANAGVHEQGIWLLGLGVVRLASGDAKGLFWCGSGEPHGRFSGLSGHSGASVN